MVDAAYLAKAIWGDGQPPETRERLAKAQRIAGQFNVHWEDVLALKAETLAERKDTEHASAQ